MKKQFICIMLVSGIVLCSCVSKKPLYTWADYNVRSYNYLKNSDEKSTQELMETYEEIINKQKGERGVTPPGIYADYAFLLLAANKTEQGKQMLVKEMELYPESKIFVERILKMIEE